MMICPGTNGHWEPISPDMVRCATCGWWTHRFNPKAHFVGDAAAQREYDDKWHAEFMAENEKLRAKCERIRALRKYDWDSAPDSLIDAVHALIDSPTRSGKEGTKDEQLDSNL